MVIKHLRLIQKIGFRMSLELLVVFGGLTLLSGWVFGYLLAKEMKGKQGLPRKAILYSLAAVSTPAVLAIIMAPANSLSSQLTIHFDSKFYSVALLFPLLVAIAGHIGGFLSSGNLAKLIPESGHFKAGAQMIPMTLIWGGLEEVAWRGFFVVQLMAYMPGLQASLVVGLVWGLWHAPQMFFSDQPFQGAFKNRPWTGAAFWTLACIVYGGVLGWLQIRSGSFVMPTLAHALLNSFGRISEGSLAGKSNPILGGTGGVCAIVGGALFLIVLYAFGIGGGF